MPQRTPPDSLHLAFRSHRASYPAWNGFSYSHHYSHDEPEQQEAGFGRACAWLSPFRQAPARRRRPVSAPKAPVAPAAIPWDAKAQGDFVTCLLQDGKTLWLGTEDQGVWRYNPNDPAPWKQFTTADGLGDNEIYALARDHTGCIWAGTLSHGVSVFSGASWRSYPVPDGPIGNRVFAIACSPVDGDVWIATDAGLSRYSLKTDQWNVYTRLDGLPSDQAQALAFNRAGALFVGTQCDGIAIAGPADDYHAWSVVAGPEHMPAADSGAGLPSRMINCILASQRSDDVYAGTPWGLARSEDSGKTWRFIRGANWDAMVKGLWRGPAPVKTLQPENWLLEDYITSLEETENGLLVIGFRQAGDEVWDPAHDKCLTHGPADYVFATQISAEHRLLIASYGSGLQQAILPASLFPAPTSAPR